MCPSTPRKYSPMSNPDAREATSLAVLVDGDALPEDQARALWQRFSDWMEEHRGDLGGFAASEGFVSVHPGVEKGRPVLYVSKEAPQRPYGSLPSSKEARRRPNGSLRSSGESTGGSGISHRNDTGDRSHRRNSKK